MLGARPARTTLLRSRGNGDQPGLRVRLVLGCHWAGWRAAWSGAPLIELGQLDLVWAPQVGQRFRLRGNDFLIRRLPIEEIKNLIVKQPVSVTISIDLCDFPTQ